MNNDFMNRVNSILEKNISSTNARMPSPRREVYPDSGIGALENVVSGAPRQTKIMGQPHMLAYINPQEEALIQSQRSGMPAFEGPDGVPAYYYGQGMKTTANNPIYQSSIASIRAKNKDQGS